MSNVSQLTTSNSTIDREKEKLYETTQTNIITEYLSMNIFNANISFYTAGLFTSYFIFQKVNDNFMAKWEVTLYPMYLYLIINTLSSFFSIIKSDEEVKDIKCLKISNIRSIQLISNFFGFILYSTSIVSLYNLQEFLDQKKDEYLFAFISILIGIFIWCLLYSLLRKLALFSLKNTLHGNSEEKTSVIGVISSLLAPLLTTLSNMTIICSGGACTQIYVSTITSLLGAFGVTLSNISQYLFPITCLLLFVSLVSLYIKKKQWTHKPFLLGILGAVMILIGKFYNKNDIRWFVYPGNVIMIIAAIWNAKMNKFSGLPI